MDGGGGGGVYTVLVVREGVATMWGPFEVRNFLFFFFSDTKIMADTFSGLAGKKVS